jgi:hypothetical protein
MPATQGSDYTLSWVGVDSACEDMSMNNKPVLAGTKLRVQLRQHQPSSRERPEEIYLFPQYEQLIARLLAKLGHAPRPLDVLDLERCIGPGDVVSQTHEWLLTPPPDIRGRLSIYCSIEGDGSNPGPKVTSVAYKTAQTTDRSGRRQQAGVGGVDIVGLPATIEIASEAGWETTASAVAALDPYLELSALLPGTVELDKYIDTYLQDVATQCGIEHSELMSAFLDEYRDLIYPPGGELYVTIYPDGVELAPGESAYVHVTVTASGAVPALFAIRGYYS